MLALIPARSGSERIPDKNILDVNGHPLMAYAIRAAINSGLFSEVYVCTDSKLYGDVARHYGASVPNLRPKEISTSLSPDRDWVEWMLECMQVTTSQAKFAFILRPTNPFRTSKTIVRAWMEFKDTGARSLRAVRPVTEHPAKMWVNQGSHIVPLLPLSINEVPMHSNQTKALFPAFIQNAALEIFHVGDFLESGQITGSSVLPFFCSEVEGFDLNTAEDLRKMEDIIRDIHADQIETINIPPFNRNR